SAEGLDVAPGRADPAPIAEQALRGWGVGAVEDDVAMAMELGLLPLGELARRDGERAQGGPLDLIEDGERDLLGRAVGAPASDLEAPAQQMAIAVVDIAAPRRRCPRRRWRWADVLGRRLRLRPGPAVSGLGPRDR